MHVHGLAAVEDRKAETRTRIVDSIHEIRPDLGPGRIVVVSADRITAVINPPAQNVGAGDPLAATINVLSERMTQMQAQINTLSVGSTRPAQRRSRSCRRSTSRD